MKDYSFDWIDIIAVVGMILTLFFIFTTPADASQINLGTIIYIESAGNSKAISYKGAKYGRGLCQISEIMLKDYNDYHSIKYTVDDLFDSEINKKIAVWALDIRIPQMLKYYKLEVNTFNILAAYNWGIGNLRDYYRNSKDMPQETKDYIKKYERNN